jgi:hypothetical protein
MALDHEKNELHLSIQPGHAYQERYRLPPFICLAKISLAHGREWESLEGIEGYYPKKRNALTAGDQIPELPKITKVYYIKSVFWFLVIDLRRDY